VNTGGRFYLEHGGNPKAEARKKSELQNPRAERTNRSAREHFAKKARKAIG
jgi:hypothetical protein